MWGGGGITKVEWKDTTGYEILNTTKHTSALSPGSEGQRRGFQGGNTSKLDTEKVFWAVGRCHYWGMNADTQGQETRWSAPRSQCLPLTVSVISPLGVMVRDKDGLKLRTDCTTLFTCGHYPLTSRLFLLQLNK